MKISSLVFSAVLAVTLSSCGTDPLIGTWTATTGTAPATETITLVITSNKTFTLTEVGPAGVTGDSTCIATNTLTGIYTETSTSITETYTGGTDAATSGCTTASNNGPGTPLTPALISAGQSAGQVPTGPATYTVTSTTLALTSTLAGTSSTLNFTKGT